MRHHITCATDNVAVDLIFNLLRKNYQAWPSLGIAVRREGGICGCHGGILVYFLTAYASFRISVGIEVAIGECHHRFVLSSMGTPSDRTTGSMNDIELERCCFDV